VSDKNNKTLKPGWRRVKLGDVVRLSKARSQDPMADGIERYVGLEHLEPGDLRIRSWGSVVDGVTFTSVFQSGQVLFGKRRAYQRKVALADFSGVCSGDIYVLETKDAQVLLPALLPFICQTDAFFDHAVGTSAGSLSPRTNWTSLADFEFVLPPIEEQQRVVRLLVSAEEARTAAEDAATHAEKLRKSLLLETFDALRGGDIVRLPFLATEVSCRWIKARDAGAILMGRQLSPKYKTGNNTKKYLRVANVFDGFIDTSDVNEMDFNDSEFETFKLQRGDVLLNEGQSRELVGRSAIFRDDIPDCCFQNTLIRFRPNEDVMSEFAHYFFQYCQYTSRFVQISKQTTSIAHLGVQRFAEMNFPLISTDAQKAIVDTLSAVVAVIPELKRRAKAASTIRNQVLMEGASR
jgi:type I restriction enzyme S subunit